MSTNETSSSEKKHTSFGEKFKGAAHVVHGIGENIRGSVMSAVESVSGSDEGKAKDEDIAAKGRSEIERGIARMKGVDLPGDTAEGQASQVPEPTKTGGQSQQQESPTTQASAVAPLSETTQRPVPSVPQSQQTVSPEMGTEPTQTSQMGKTEYVQPGSSDRATQAVPMKSSVLGTKGLIGEGADAPGGPGTNIL